MPEDVVYVVDAGRSRTTFFNEQTMISALRTVWYSKANGFQRRGRAGRCRPGVWYRLFTSVQWDAMDEYELPEMQRSPLEELCLEVRSFRWASFYVHLLQCGTGRCRDGLRTSHRRGTQNISRFHAHIGNVLSLIVLHMHAYGRYMFILNSHVYGWPMAIS